MKQITVFYLTSNGLYSNGQSLTNKEEAMMPLSKIKHYLARAEERHLDLAFQIGYIYVSDEDASDYESLGSVVSSVEEEKIVQFKQIIEELFPTLSLGEILFELEIEYSSNPELILLYEKSLEYAKKYHPQLAPRFEAVFGTDIKQVQMIEQELACPNCQHHHLDVDEWAIRPHKTHLCLFCSFEFESKIKGVSRPIFEELIQPSNLVYVPF